MNLKIDDLYVMQNELDQRIFDKFAIERKSTQQERILALIVELAECVNETRCFKFWSTKGPNEKSVILEEFVDGIHFLLSIGLDLKDETSSIKASVVSDDLTCAYLEMFRETSKLTSDYSLKQYHYCFALYLAIAQLLGFNEEEIRSFYLMKNQENHQRQTNNY